MQGVRTHSATCFYGAYFHFGDNKMHLNKEAIQEIIYKGIKSQWLAAPGFFPEFLTEISRETQVQNEAYLQSVSDDFQRQIKIFPVRAKDRAKWKRKMQIMLPRVLGEETIIGVHLAMDSQGMDAFMDGILEFLRYVREFAPELPLEGIGQAVRNYIVYAMFNELHGIRQGFSRACFGYSMLYPFTDNFIDSRNYSDQEKREYNRIIRNRIEGKEVHPVSAHQRKTCELLAAIEEEYPREKDSTIFTLLLLMLEAQEESIRQQMKDTPLSEAEILDISLFKGGLSVLIDRFFVHSEITENDLIFYLGFGFFLQLADDLQDIEEDSAKGHQTLLTVDTHCRPEEMTVNKMLHFLHRLMHDFQAENEPFAGFVLRNCELLILASVIGSRSVFSDAYVEQLEKYLPVSYPFLEKMKIQRIYHPDDSNQNKYLKILDEMVRNG